MTFTWGHADLKFKPTTAFTYKFTAALRRPSGDQSAVTHAQAFSLLCEAARVHLAPCFLQEGMELFLRRVGSDEGRHGKPFGEEDSGPATANDAGADDRDVSHRRRGQRLRWVHMSPKRVITLC